MFLVSSISDAVAYLRDPSTAECITEPTSYHALRQPEGAFRPFWNVRANNGCGGKAPSIFSRTVAKGTSGTWQLQNPKEMRSQ